MPPKKQSDGQWLADFYTVNRSKGKTGKRVRKKFATKGEALAFETYTLQKIEDSPWLSESVDKRTLTDIIHLWYDRYGITLGNGLRRKATMLWAAEQMGFPLASEFNAQLFSAYRGRRLEGKLGRINRAMKISPSSINLEHTFFLSVFNELKRLGEWTKPNPLEGLRRFSVHESEMSFLTVEQISLLLSECRNSKIKDLELVVKICLSTGARWSEAQGLTHSQVTGGRITFVKTKSKKNRSVPIDVDLMEEIPNKTGRLFDNCYYAFQSAIERSGIELPPGQCTHVLRHTFASHFMMNGGNILVLQRILGHSDIKMTMRYAHFAPDHLEDAIRLNPLKCRKNVASS